MKNILPAFSISILVSLTFYLTNLNTFGDDTSPIQWNGYIVVTYTKPDSYNPGLVNWNMNGNWNATLDGKTLNDWMQPPADPPNTNLWFPQNTSLQGSYLQQVLSLTNGPITPYNGGTTRATSAECYIDTELNYGTYLVTVQADQNMWEALRKGGTDCNTTFGIFTYSQTPASSLNPYSELDIVELGMQGNPTLQGSFQSVIQPWNVQGNLQRLDFTDDQWQQIYSNGGFATFRMDWSKNSVTFYCAPGNYSSVRSFPSVQPTFTYTNTKYIPEPSEEMKLYINLWTRGGPADGKQKTFNIINIVIP